MSNRPTRLRRRTWLTLAATTGLLPSLITSEVRSETPNPWIRGTVDGLRYDVLLPDQYDAAKAYPVVLYLHQLDMGSDPRVLHQQIDGWFTSLAFRSRHPCIVVVPMLDQTKDRGGQTVNFGGKQQGGPYAAATIAALRQVLTRYRTDPARVYVTGNSMGGLGTWDMLLSYNALTGTSGRLFAAGMPLAGAHRSVRPEVAAPALRDVPIWAIHGAQDRSVGPDWDRAVARLLKGRPNFRYTEDPGLGHDVWDKYYADSRVWDWLFAQKAPTSH